MAEAKEERRPCAPQKTLSKTTNFFAQRQGQLKTFLYPIQERKGKEKKYDGNATINGMLFVGDFMKILQFI